MLLYRRDLLERYGLPVPQSWDELKEVGRPAAGSRAPGRRAEFYGFATRGAAGGGHAVWTIASFVASFGGAWLDAAAGRRPISDAHEAALASYVDLLRAVAPPDQAQISFVELLRDFRAGRVGMIIEVGMEYAHLFATTRSSPRSRAWRWCRRAGRSLCQPLLPALGDPGELEARGRSLGAGEVAVRRRAQLLEDGQQSQALETASLSRSLQPRVRPPFPRRSARGRARHAGDRPRGAALFDPRHRGLHHRRRSHDQGADRRARDSRRAGDACNVRSTSCRRARDPSGWPRSDLDRAPTVAWSRAARSARRRADPAGPARRRSRRRLPAAAPASMPDQARTATAARPAAQASGRPA